MAYSKLLRAYLSSPAHTQLRKFVAIDCDTVEIYKTQLGRSTVKERELPMQEAINLRASLIQQGWIEMTAPELG